MDMVSRDRIINIAQRVRNWCQEKADWSDYNADDLNGWCAIAAGQLHRELSKLGIRSTIHMYDQYGECHVFVVVDDHVVDVTATQFREFSHKPVVLMHMKEAEVYEFYRSDRIFDSVHALRQHQRADGWNSRQIAYER